MNKIADTYINALLADATYAKDLIDGLKGAGLRDALTARMTLTLATFISSNFEVVSHKETDDAVQGSGSGFDATVWRGVAGSAYAGKVYVSMQGTLGEQDFITDFNLALPLGRAGKQIVDMVNWWNQITTSGEAAQIKEVSVGVPATILGLKYFTAAPPVAGTGLLSATSVQVNGHSLGGNLATVFARLFGDRAGGVAIDGVTSTRGQSQIVFH